MIRKIDKRACRKFSAPGLTFNLNDGVLHAESVQYIIRTAVRNISGQRILILYIYPRENILAGISMPRWVMFQGRDDYATLSLRKDAAATWQCSSIDSLERTYGFDSKCAFYQQQDETRVAHFCRCEFSAFSALKRLQWAISSRKARERKWKKQQVIVQRMEHIPALPRDLKGFIHRVVMPQYIFYDYQRKAPRHPYCTACRHEVNVAAARHNAAGICPRCKRDITFKSRGKSRHIFDRATVQVLQRMDNGELLLRIIKIYRAFVKSDTPNLNEIYENARHFILPALDGHCCTQPYYYSFAGRDDLTPWRNGYRPQFSYWQDNFEADMSGTLYTRNLADTLRDTPWKYSQLESYAHTVAQLETISYLKAYARWPMIEYLVKLKLYRLVTDIVYRVSAYSVSKTLNLEGKTLKAVLGIDRSQLPLLQEVDPGIMQLRMIRSIIDAGEKPNVDMLKWCADNAIESTSIITELLAYMSMHKLCRYADAQYTIYGASAQYRYRRGYYSMSNLLADYRDYLHMCEQLQYDTKNSFVLFPRRLKMAHDQAVQALNDKHTAEQEQAIADSFEMLKRRYQFRGKKMMIVPPRTAKDLVDEGTALHHCVGQYVKKVAQNKCVILFVRKVSEPDKSLCTIEVRDGQVVQARCFGNQEPPAPITAFIEQWKRRVLYAADEAA